MSIEDDLATRRRRARYRAWHRGTKEMDLILGGFADAALDALTPSDLAAFERLLEESDVVLYRWVAGREPVPTAARTALLDALLAFWQRRAAGAERAP